MDETTRSRIRHIFLSAEPSFALRPAAELLGLTVEELQQELETGAIVAVSTDLGQRVTRGEMIGVAMRTWEQSVVEEALGDDAATLLPAAFRLVELRARVPRYQRDMLRYFAERHGTSVDEVLMRELEDVACAHAEQLAAAVPDFEVALMWPEDTAATAR